MIYHHMYGKSNKKKITAGIIGSGHYGTAIITQSMSIDSLEIPIIADRNTEAAKKAFFNAGITEDQISICDSVDSVKEALKLQKRIVVNDASIVMNLDLDMIVESTGNPEAGAKHCIEAINSGKHVIMVNKETDSVVGPVLNHMAAEKGLVYTPVDGDQHGLLIQMVEWARDLGLKVISAGKSRDAEFIYNRELGTVTCEEDGITVHKTTVANVSKGDIKYINDLPQNEVSEYIKKRQELLSNLDGAGGFDLCELVIVANVTGLTPDVQELHQAIVRTTEIPKVLCPKKDGGILSENGTIEVLTCLREPHEAGLGGGMFMVVSCDNEYSQMILNTKGCISNYNGSCALIYRPYHLCGVETPVTLLCAGLLGVSTGGRKYVQNYDIAQIAAVDLKAGEVMGNDHDTRMKTVMIKASPISEGGAIPAHMLNGLKLKKNISKGTLITYDMVETPADSVLWSLRARQDAMKF